MYTIMFNTNYKIVRKGTLYHRKIAQDAKHCEVKNVCMYEICPEKAQCTRSIWKMVIANIMRKV